MAQEPGQLRLGTTGKTAFQTIPSVGFPDRGYRVGSPAHELQQRPVGRDLIENRVSICEKILEQVIEFDQI